MNYRECARRLRSASARLIRRCRYLREPGNLTTSRKTRRILRGWRDRPQYLGSHGGKSDSVLTEGYRGCARVRASSATNDRRSEVTTTRRRYHVVRQWLSGVAEYLSVLYELRGFTKQSCPGAVQLGTAVVLSSSRRTAPSSSAGAVLIKNSHRRDFIYEFFFVPSGDVSFGAGF